MFLFSPRPFTDFCSHMKMALFLSSAIVACTFHLQGQLPSRAALGLEVFSSGNTHGTFYRPYVGWEIGRNFLSAGPLVQKESAMIKGLKIGYSRNMSGPADRDIDYDPLQLNLISYIQYSELLPMSARAVQEQYQVNRLPDVRWESVKLSTAELGIGFELRVNLKRYVCWNSACSMATYYHTRYFKGLTSERCGVSLALRTGMLFFLP
jgi:hypothetical protein